MSTLYINTQGAMLRNRAGRFVVTQGDQELESIPQCALDSVVLLGHVQVTTQAAHALLDAGAPVIYLSAGGQFRGILQPGYPRDGFRRISQYDASLDTAFSRNIACNLVLSKLVASERTLRKWIRNGWLEPIDLQNFRAARCACRDARDPEVLRGIEARAAVQYFNAMGQSVPPPFWWDGRNRRPPRDPVNALLSFSYMLAVGEAVSVCFASGLDPFIGFFHTLDYGRPSLALDLIEPVRSLYCDHFVMRILQREALHPDDFQSYHDKGCRLKPQALRRFLEIWESEDKRPAPRQQVRRFMEKYCRNLVESIRKRNPSMFLLPGGDSTQ